MSKIHVEDLASSSSASNEEWLNEYMRKHKLGKSDLNVLSVSAQVLVTELFEEMELLSNQATSIAVPNVKDVLTKLERELEGMKSESEYSAIPDSLEAEKLSALLARAAELNRARINIQAVRDRILSRPREVA
jgi:hypothetical protein